MHPFLRSLAASAAGTALAWLALTSCGDGGEETTATAPRDSGRPDSTVPTDAASSQDAAPSPVQVNGVVVVHAASFGPFRLCFESALARRPFPEAERMPESNVAGIDVGGAVRLDTRELSTGRVWAFSVDDVAEVYPPGQPGLTCDELLSSSLGQKAHEVGSVSDEIRTGAHLLVLRGSAEADDLRLQRITLSPFSRPRMDRLPVQVLMLASGLVERAEGRPVSVAFGDLLDPSVPEQPFVEAPLRFGFMLADTPHQVAYEPDDEGAYAAKGFVVTLGAASADEGGADGGVDAAPGEILVAQSLAEIQRLSSPRALPREWFAAASSYVLVLLDGSGEDGGAPDASDPRRGPHLLAFPLAAPTDAGGVE